jgi:di/tricarboxylate transporter
VIFDSGDSRFFSIQFLGNLVQTKLLFGDSVLVGGEWGQIELLQAERENFLVLNLPREMDEIVPNRSQAPWALGIIGGILVLMRFKLVPSVAAALWAVLAMVFACCVSMNNAYTSINWESLVLIAGMLPIATALEKTGGIQLIVNGLVGSPGELRRLCSWPDCFCWHRYSVGCS